MIRTSEYVSLGHPDAVADFIVSYLLDDFIRHDTKCRFAVECQIKDNHITLGGEVTTTSKVMDRFMIDESVRRAINHIGYTCDYARKWGRGNCIDPSDLDIVQHIGQQSPDIAQGVNADGWGDQGIFWGLACAGEGEGESTGFMPLDHFLAKKIGQRLYGDAKSGALDIGLDIKTQVTIVDGSVSDVVVAAPMRGDPDEIETLREKVMRIVSEITEFGRIVINGTGSYVRHASQGDCGTTGRKLAVDFYGGNCRIGGGAPWGKDPSKADVSLNIYANALARRMLEKNGSERIYCSISCCIGRKDIRIAYFDEKMNEICDTIEERPAPEIIEELGLYEPVFAFKKENGLFTCPA